MPDVRICERAYRILVDGFPPQEAASNFHPNILTVATGIEEHNNYAVDFINATRWIGQPPPRQGEPAASPGLVQLSRQQPGAR